MSLRARRDEGECSRAGMRSFGRAAQLFDGPTHRLSFSGGPAQAPSSSARTGARSMDDSDASCPTASPGEEYASNPALVTVSTQKQSSCHVISPTLISDPPRLVAHNVPLGSSLRRTVGHRPIAHPTQSHKEAQRLRSAFRCPRTVIFNSIGGKSLRIVRGLLTNLHCSGAPWSTIGLWKKRFGTTRASCPSL